jgi:hypothetical protein
MCVSTLAGLAKCILRKYGCPPNKEEKETQMVLEQAKVLRRD